MRRPPPGWGYVAAASIGALALGVGGAAALTGSLWGLALALGGLVLLGWSVAVTRKV